LKKNEQHKLTCFWLAQRGKNLEKSKGQKGRRSKMKKGSF